MFITYYKIFTQLINLSQPSPLVGLLSAIQKDMMIKYNKGEVRASSLPIANL